MTKKSQEETAKKIEAISNTINVIMQNRLIIAFLFVADGVTFILNPDTTLPEMAKSIILLILLAAVSVLATNLAAKVKDRKTIAISIVVIILGAIFYFYPDFVSAYIQLLLALFIIYEGIMNISGALNSSRLSKFTRSLAEKYNKTFNKKPETKKEKAQREKFKEIDNNINAGLEQQKEKLINPLKGIVEKTNKSSKLYIVANAASIILGLILLIFPDVSMVIWGLIFLYTGLPNLIATIKVMNLSQKIKERKFKEIVLDDGKSTSSKDTADKTATKNKRATNKSDAEENARKKGATNKIAVAKATAKNKTSKNSKKK